MLIYITNGSEKVFGIGLSRTGTRSLNQALEHLGYRAFHWRFSSENRLVALGDAYFCDAITDINAAFQFEILDRTFPAAKFVYTTRPLESWVPAVSAHYDAASPDILLQQLRAIAVEQDPTKPIAIVHTPLYHAIHHTLYTGHRSWRDAYEAHESRVRSHFEGRPEKLLTLGIVAEGGGWPELCAFLGKPVPSMSFPRIDWHTQSVSANVTA
jgi:hypothetical protein